jgi:hypothetical protein
LRSSAILAKIHAAARHGRADAVTPGIYASANYFIYGYSGNDRSNRPPVCSISPAGDSYDIAVDRQGDLLVPAFQARTITVYAGPGLCGPKLGMIAEPYGEPVDVASRNVANGGKIVVANVVKVGSVSVCTLSGGCTKLSAGHIQMTGVALAPNGDCWATGDKLSSPSAGPVLVYFAHCRGHGVIATGFQIPSTSYVLDIDDNGNLVTVAYDVYISGKSLSELYIHSGCNPACTLVGGPFQLKGSVLYGHLDASSKMFVGAVDTPVTAPKLEVYSYSTSGIKYEYSNTNSVPQFVSGAAFSPPSKE